MPEEDPELEALRQKRMAQLQMQDQNQKAVSDEKERVEAQKKAILRKVLTVEAKERVGRLKLGYPDMAAAIENQLIMLHQSGKLPGPVDDETLKRLLSQVQPKKREINIVRK
jgi:programmed cell death protein 5